MIQNFLQSCDYENGYKQAVTDIKNWFSNHSITLKWHKMSNIKGIGKLLSAIEKNAEQFMKTAEDTEFILTDKGEIRLNEPKHF